MILRIALLLFGVLACSTAIIMIKASGMRASGAAKAAPILLASFRMLIAAAALTPLFVRDLRRHRDRFGWGDMAPAILSGVVLSAHFLTWIIGALATRTVNASLIVNMAPVVMPFLMFVMIREKITRGELAGTVLAIIGLALLMKADFQFSPDHFRGDVICFGSMLLFCFYLALGRRNRHFASIWLYVVPVYFVGGVLCLAAGLVVPHEPVTYDTKEILLIIGLGLIPTVIGHSLLNYSMRHLRGQIVSIFNLFQFIFAGTLAYIFFSEIPGPAFYYAAALLIAGALVVMASHRKV